MIPILFSIVGVIVGVFAVGKSTSLLTDSEALILIGISVIGGAIYFRRKLGIRD